MFPVFADFVLLPAVIVGLVRVPLAPQSMKTLVILTGVFLLFALVEVLFHHILHTLRYAAIC